MNQAALVEALKSQLDLAEHLFNWALIFSAAVAWAGLQRQPYIEAFHVKVDRRDAFVAIAVLYLFATTVAIVLFLRIGDLFTLVDCDHFGQAVTIVATHQWILNPFSYFGPSSVARSYSAEGNGLLIAVWWLCNSSLYTLIDVKQSRRAKVLLVIFVMVGVVAVFSLRRAYFIILRQAETLAPTLSDQLAATVPERRLALFLGIAAGALIFIATNRLQQRWHRRPITSDAD